MDLEITNLKYVLYEKEMTSELIDKLIRALGYVSDVYMKLYDSGYGYNFNVIYNNFKYNLDMFKIDDGRLCITTKENNKDMIILAEALSKEIDGELRGYSDLFGNLVKKFKK